MISPLNLHVCVCVCVWVYVWLTDLAFRFLLFVCLFAMPIYFIVYRQPFIFAVCVHFLMMLHYIHLFMNIVRVPACLYKCVYYDGIHDEPQTLIQIVYIRSWMSSFLSHFTLGYLLVCMHVCVCPVYIVLLWQLSLLKERKNKRRKFNGSCLVSTSVIFFLPLLLYFISCIHTFFRWHRNKLFSHFLSYTHSTYTKYIHMLSSCHPLFHLRECACV